MFFICVNKLYLVLKNIAISNTAEKLFATWHFNIAKKKCQFQITYKLVITVFVYLQMWL